MMKLCSISCMTDILKVPHAKQDKGVIRKCSSTTESKMISFTESRKNAFAWLLRIRKQEDKC